MGNIYSAAKVKHANTRRNRQFYATVNPIGGNQFAQQTEREWMPSDGKLISSAVLKARPVYMHKIFERQKSEI